MFSWYQIESDSAASPVSCKSYLASTDSETFAAVITFHSCKNALSQYFRPPCRSDKTLHSWIYFLKLDRIVFYSLRTPTYRCFFCLFFNAVLFFVPNRVGVGVVSRGIQTGSANCIYCERNVKAGGREGCRETELPFMLKKKYQKYGWEWSEGKKKHTVEENPNCQTGVASAGRPGYNRGCSNLWENVLRSEDMSAAPIKTIITESSPSLRGREAERGSPSGGEGKVCPGCKATPAKLVDSQISTKNFIYLRWRSSRLFLMCIYWNSGPWTHTVSRTESDWGRLMLWILYYSRVIVVFWSRERWMRRRSRGGHPDCFIDYFLL